jgi:hypothetical protein
MQRYITLKMERRIRNFSLISYLLIMLSGQMISLPFGFWLAFNIFQFGELEQLFAFIGVVGIVLNMIRLKRNLFISIIGFVFMLIPLFSRFYEMSFSKFNYLSFQIPFTLFVLTYLVSMVLLVLLINKNEK